ncbi:MAG: hypothetical protein AAF074_13745 [Pseudomonadota bacterium]
MHYAAQGLVVLLYPLLGAALLWPVVGAVRVSRPLRALLGAIVLLPFLWGHWLGWHFAEGARAEGPHPRSTWLRAAPAGEGPYAFDAAAGFAEAARFAQLTPAAWRGHFRELSKTAGIDRPHGKRYRPSEPAPQFRPATVRWFWAAEPLVLWLCLAAMIWWEVTRRLARLT